MTDACCCSFDGYDYCDGEPVDLFKSKWRTARKTHQCSECKGDIKKGDRHEYARMLSDGHWDTFRTCLICKRMINDLMCGHQVYGCVAEVLRECINYDLYEQEFVGAEPA